MKNLLLFLLLGLIFVFIVYLVIAYITLRPKNPKFRIVEKTNGALTLYRSEFYRPLLGWTGFWASKYSAEIWVSENWDSSYQSCLENIKTYIYIKSNKFKTKVVEE